MHIQKISLIFLLILEILLIYHFEVFWAYPTMPSMPTVNQFIPSMDVFSIDKKKLFLDIISIILPSLAITPMESQELQEFSFQTNLGKIK